MQQVRVIVATGEQIEQEIAQEQELFKGWSLIGPVQWGGTRNESAGSFGLGTRSIERAINLYVATLVREIP